MSPYSAGVDAQEITPSRKDVEAGKVYLWGFTLRKDPALPWREDDDRLWSRALVLADGPDRSRRVALVSVDVCALSPELVQVVRNRVSEWVPPERVLINVTHTHCAPVTVAIPTYSPELSQPQPGYLKLVEDQVVTSIEKAVEKLRPATLWFQRGQVGIGVNRHFENGAYDTHLDVLWALGAGGETIATAFFHGCHPLCYQGREISADFPGVARQCIVKDSGGAALFFQGYGGTINPSGDAKALGCALAKKVLELRKGSLQELKGPIAARRSVIAIPLRPIERETLVKASEPHGKEFNWADVQKPDLARWAKSLLGKWPAVPGSLDVELQLISVGEPPNEWLLLASSHEVVAELAAPLREMMPHQERLTLAGYSNGQISYLPTRAVMASPESRFPFDGVSNYDGAHSFVYYGHRAPTAETVDTLFLRGITRLMNPAWEEIGKVPAGFLALTSARARDLKRDMLFAASADGKLWWRDPAGTADTWEHIGHGSSDVAGIASSGEWLYAASRNHKLGERPTIHNLKMLWRQLSDVGFDVVAMAGLGGKLYAATGDNRLMRGQRKTDDSGYDWKDIGHAHEVRGMATLGNQLIVTTRDGRWWRRDTEENDKNWELFGQNYKALAVTSIHDGAGGTLFAVEVDGTLSRRRF